MHFCPNCSNLLLVEVTSCVRFFCQTCPYVCNVTKPIYSELPLVKKEVDDVMGGAADWENAPKADARCPKCEHTRAYYFQVQIRSADEPMTTFYKCVSCGNRWNDNS